MSNIDDLWRNLIAAAPELEAVRQEHLADHDEVLPHLLLADVTRWVVEHGPTPAVLPVLGVLERHMNTGTEYAREVITLSFLENLFGDASNEVAIRAALGPRLRAEFDARERWTPEDRGGTG